MLVPIREHPADDNEPVTEEWFQGPYYLNRSKTIPSRRSRTQNTNSVWIDYDAKNGLTLSVPSQNGGMLHLYFGKKTRGDVRRLCTALGIELKEQGE